MIQDILPQALDNSFSLDMPNNNDFIMIYEGRSMLLAGDPNDDFRIPTLAEILAELPDIKTQAQTFYAFSINGEKIDGEEATGFGRYFLGLMPALPADMLKTQLEAAHSQDIFLGEFLNLASRGRRAERMAASTGAHLNAWYGSNRICGRCGKKMERSQIERAMLCPHCHNIVYPRINPVVAVAVTNGDKILLTRYANRPYRERSIVAGFCEIGETAEQAVAREVLEETGLRVRNINYLKSQPWGVDGNLMLGFSAEVDGDTTVDLDRHELESAEWVERSQIFETDDDLSITRSIVIDFKEGRF